MKKYPTVKFFNYNINRKITEVTTWGLESHSA